MTQLLLPIIALLIALIVVAGLWYWWISSQPETPEGDQTQPDQPGQPAGQAAGPGIEERLRGIMGSIRGAFSGVMSGTGGTIEIRRGGQEPATSGHSEMIEIMRIFRDLSNGALVIQIGRDRYYSLDEISDPQVRRRFLGNAEAMAQFAQLKKGTSPLIDWAPASTTVNQSRPAPSPAQPAPNMPPPPPPMPSAQPSAPPSSRSPLAIIDQVVTGGSGGAKKDEPPPKSMADEIEELLQYRLALDPQLNSRSIHIRSSEDGSIFVEVDGQNFDGIGEVSDEQVRSYLQKIVQEWEARK